MPERKQGEFDKRFIDRVVANLSQDEASELITNLIIEQQSNNLSRYLGDPAHVIRDTVAHNEFKKPYAETNRHERTRIQRALQRLLTQEKNKTSNDPGPQQLALGTN